NVVVVDDDDDEKESERANERNFASLPIKLDARLFTLTPSPLHFDRKMRTKWSISSSGNNNLDS
ncbi:hypothetical protein RDWZM_002848, partial [Blomia tropicalis]